MKQPHFTVEYRNLDEILANLKSINNVLISENSSLKRDQDLDCELYTISMIIRDLESFKANPEYGEAIEQNEKIFNEMITQNQQILITLNNE